MPGTAANVKFAKTVAIVIDAVKHATGVQDDGSKAVTLSKLSAINAADDVLARFYTAHTYDNLGDLAQHVIHFHNHLRHYYDQLRRLLDERSSNSGHAAPINGDARWWKLPNSLYASDLRFFDSAHGLRNVPLRKKRRARLCEATTTPSELETVITTEWNPNAFQRATQALNGIHQLLQSASWDFVRRFAADVHKDDLDLLRTRLPTLKVLGISRIHMTTLNKPFFDGMDLTNEAQTYTASLLITGLTYPDTTCE